MTTSAAASTRYYVPSGRVAWHAPLQLAIIGAVSAALLAAVYTLVIRYNPLIYISCLATIGFGALLGGAARWACQSGRSRSRAFNAFAGLAVGLLGLWLHWLMWTWLMVPDDGATARHLAASGPGRWMDFLTYTADHRHLSVGKFGSDGAEESPTFMLWTWGFEAFAVLLLSTLCACVAQAPFSERTMKWAAVDWKGEFAIDATTPLDRDQLERRLQQEGVTWLAAMNANGRIVNDKSPGVRLSLECLSAPGDPSCAFISVSKVTQRGEKGKVRSALTTNRRVDAAAYQRLVQLLKNA